MKAIEFDTRDNGLTWSIYTESATIEFSVWNYDEFSEKDIFLQFKTAFGICSNFEEIEKHMKINGIDADLLDIIED